MQKTATAVAHCKQGNGIMKVNGRPLHLMEPATLRYKVSLFVSFVLFVFCIYIYIVGGATASAGT